MRILFVSAPLPGHLDWGGYLLTAAELVKRGHDVLWATGAAMEPLLKAHKVPVHVLQETGWRWPPPPPITPEEFDSPQAYQQQRMERSLDQWLEVERVAAAVEELLEVGRSFHPDLIGGEMFVAAAGLVAELLDIPYIVVGWPALRTHVGEEARAVVESAHSRLDTLCTRFGVDGKNWEREGPPGLLSPHLHLTFWSESWYKGLPLLVQTETVGGTASKPQPWRTPWLSKLPMDQPWIFITLGTSFTSDPNFFIAAAHAAAQVGGLPILALGNNATKESMLRLQTRLPKPTVLVGRVNFGEVLPYAAAAIHHGGAGTTHALVTHAVPQIVVPHAADQARQAEGVARSGVGYRILPRQVTIPILVQMLKNALPHDSRVRENARSLKKEFAELGGVSRAADLVQRLDPGANAQESL